MTRSSKVTSKRNLGGSLAVLFATLAVLLASCRTPEPPVAQGIDRVGVVLLSQVGDDAPSGQATFMQLSQARAEELMNNAFGAEVGTCQVGTATAALPGGVTPGQGSNRLAAATLDLVTSGGAYGRLVRTGDRYTLEGATQPLPANLGVRLRANAVFPSFSNMSVNTGATPVLAAGFDATNVTRTSEFRWEPGPAGSAIVLIGTSSDGAVSYSCVADDSAGSFVFPEATKAALTSAGFSSGNLATLGRMTVSQARAESALLLVGTLRLATVGTDR